MTAAGAAVAGELPRQVGGDPQLPRGRRVAYDMWGLVHPGHPPVQGGLRRPRDHATSAAGSWPLDPLGHDGLSRRARPRASASRPEPRRGGRIVERVPRRRTRPARTMSRLVTERLHEASAGRAPRLGRPDRRAAGRRRRAVARLGRAIARASAGSPGTSCSTTGSGVLSLERPWPLVGGAGAYLSHGPIAAGEPVERTAGRLRAAADHLASARRRRRLVGRRDRDLDRLRRAHRAGRLPADRRGALVAPPDAPACCRRARTRRPCSTGSRRPCASSSGAPRRPGSRSPTGRRRGPSFQHAATTCSPRPRPGASSGSARGRRSWSGRWRRSRPAISSTSRCATRRATILGGATFYRHGGRLTYSHSGDRVEVRRQYPGVVRLLLWQAIQDRPAPRASTEMDLGGVDVAGARRIPVEGEPMYGLYMFKRSFGAEWVEQVGNHEWVARPWRYGAGRVTGKVAALGRGAPDEPDATAGRARSPRRSRRASRPRPARSTASSTGWAALGRCRPARRAPGWPGDRRGGPRRASRSGASPPTRGSSRPAPCSWRSPGEHVDGHDFVAAAAAAGAVAAIVERPVPEVGHRPARRRPVDRAPSPRPRRGGTAIRAASWRSSG